MLHRPRIDNRPSSPGVSNSVLGDGPTLDDLLKRRRIGGGNLRPARMD